MHDTAYEIGQKFLGLYWTHDFGRIFDVGSRDVNGTLKDFRANSEIPSRGRVADAEGEQEAMNGMRKPARRNCR